jgi:LPS export ABC transporter protein LptC
MDRSRNGNTKTFKRVLLLFILAATGVVITVFWGYRSLLTHDDRHISIGSGDAKMSIRKFHQVATRNGIKEWRLEAGSAKYVDPKQLAVLLDISVIFFLKDNGSAHLSADRGVLKTKSNDIEVSGNVVVTNNNYMLKTESLNYLHDKRLIESNVPVQMVGESFRFTAESLSLDLQSNRATLVGNVEATFNEMFAL